MHMKGIEPQKDFIIVIIINVLKYLYMVIHIAQLVKLSNFWSKYLVWKEKVFFFLVFFFFCSFGLAVVGRNVVTYVYRVLQVYLFYFILF